MDEPRELQHNGRWRMAVWALRVGYIGLAVACAGLIVTLSGSTPWVLAVGVIVWLGTAAVTLTGFVLARHALPDPRPTVWSMRTLLHGAAQDARGCSPAHDWRGQCSGMTPEPGSSTS